MTTTYLDRIIAEHRDAAAADERSLEQLMTRALATASEPRPFRQALTNDGLAIIAEVKRRSPSKGDLFADLDPRVLAEEYRRGGAACLSVLTDGPNFGGSLDDLVAARESSGLPVLRKDFTVDERDVCDARIFGADAVLLIVAALDDDELQRFAALADHLGLDVLVETHDEAEVERALAVGADLVGVNQRDLVTFEVDHERAVTVVAAIPDGVVKVAESGVRDAVDAESLAAAGFDAVLVGESLLTSSDPAGSVRALRQG